MSSISRYDDLKCVPRILCEVASGNPPGEYKQAENNEQYLGESGRNIFTQFVFFIKYKIKKFIITYDTFH